MSTTKLVLLYLLVCIPVRIGIAIGAKYIPVNYLPLASIVAFITSFLWLWKFFNNKQGKSKGAFGQIVWWNNMRMVHALIWIAFGILALFKNKYAYLLLLLDVFVGLGGWCLNKMKN